MRVPVIVSAVLLVGLLAPVTGHATTTIDPHPVITEFHEDLTAGNGAWGIAPGPDGDVWFTEDNIDSVARVTSEGEITEFPLGLATGCPKGIALGPDGNLWVALSSGGGAIARVTPEGEVTEFTDALLVGEPWDITAGPDGNLWFVVRNPAAIGRITPGGEITLFDAGLTPWSEPTSIAAGADGNLWFTESADPGRIGKVTTAGVITEYSAGLTSNMRPADITLGPDDKMWFTETASPGAIGRIKPSGEITEFTNFSDGTAPTGIAAGNDGALWFTQAADPGSIGRITTDGRVTEHDDGLSPDQGPWFITRGPDGNMWFTENRGSGHVARVIVGPGVGDLAAEAGRDYAHLSAYVQGNSQTTDYRFVWGEPGGPSETTELFAAGRSAKPMRVAVKVRELEPGTTYEFHVVATNDAGSTKSRTAKFTTQPEPLRDDPKYEVSELLPDFASSVVAEPRGNVRFKAPGGAWHKLEQGNELPVGVTIDARRGSVVLTSEGRRAEYQTGTFGGGLFAIRQGRRARGRVDLHLRGGSFASCKRPGRRGRGRRAGASAKRTVRRLWGRDSGGRFRTHGRHSHATVRGTRWLTEDRCGGTLTRVTEGSVMVRDLAKRKSVLVRAGHSYLARPRR